MDNRRCPRCAETKLVTEFGARSNGKYQPYCKPCMKDVCYEWKANHPEQSKAHRRKCKMMRRGIIPKRGPGRPALTGDETEAKCSCCNLVKPLSGFYGGRNNRSTYCKPCARNKSMDRYYMLKARGEKHVE